MLRGRLWRVYVEPETSSFRVADSKGKTLDEEGMLGCCYMDNREIHLSATLRGARLERIFVHELLHAVMPWPKAVVSGRTEEKVVEAMADPLTEVLRQLKWRR